MASRLIVLRQRVAAAFRSAIVTFGREVTSVLAARAGKLLRDGETADKAHLDETAGDRAGRLARDGAAQALRKKLVDIRAIARTRTRSSPSTGGRPPSPSSCGARASTP